ncbi:MAG: chitobiase/beta-hexosaminidase C-terminal domain-containing protein, partial [Acidobacteriaceae bacterium]
VQETITVNQASQAITFTTPSSATTSVVYGASPITLAATGGGSGSAVTFSLDASSTAGAGSLSGSTLTITGVGTIVVDANQAGTANYSAATQVQVSIAVTAATQTITFTSPATSGASVTYPGTVTLAATGGASGNAVTFSLVSGGSVATLTGNVLTPTGTAFGAVVVAADQAGNSDYGAAATVQTTIVFAPIGTVATPAITPASGTLYTNGEQGSTVSISISDSTANAAIYYTLNGGTPTLYSGPIPLAASDTAYTITATASELGYTPSSQATATYTVDNLAPNFTVSVSPGAVDLTPGSSAIVDITITPNASFLGTVTFSCSGAPSGVTCAFSPSSLTANGVNSLTTVLTITDAATTSANRRGPNPFIPGGATFALALCFLGFRKRRSLILSLVLLAGIFGLTQLTGCGSNAGNSSTGSTTSSMTVTATSAYNGTTITQTLPITITIRK